MLFEIDDLSPYPPMVYIAVRTLTSQTIGFGPLDHIFVDKFLEILRKLPDTLCNVSLVAWRPAEYLRRSL